MLFCYLIISRYHELKFAYDNHVISALLLLFIIRNVTGLMARLYVFNDDSFTTLGLIYWPYMMLLEYPLLFLMYHVLYKVYKALVCVFKYLWTVMKVVFAAVTKCLVSGFQASANFMRTNVLKPSQKILTTFFSFVKKLNNKRGKYNLQTVNI